MVTSSTLPKTHGSIIKAVKILPPAIGTFWLRAFNFYLRRRERYLRTTKYGFVMNCSPRDLVQVCIMQFGHWEPNICAVIESLVKPGSCAADVGANVGYDTLLLSQLVGSHGAVVAFEASARTYALLQENLDLNKQVRMFEL